MRKNTRTTKTKRHRKPSFGPGHPWRLCPLGKFFRSSHGQSGYTRGDGKVVSGSVHPDECVTSRSGLDEIYPEELKLISEQRFAGLSGPPAPDDLGFEHGNDYDALIRGWTRFWNEILSPTDPLDPNIVKALIASESGFDADSRPSGKGSGRARGLMQITSATRKILSDENGELGDHLVNVNDDQLFDPNLNIAAGTRWLFRKMQIARSRLGPKATWRDAVAEYKDYDSDSPKMKIFDNFLKRLLKK